MLIFDAIGQTNDPKQNWWIQQIYQYFCHRLRELHCDWIDFLADMNDRQAVGRYVEYKHQKYCLMIRDAARKQKRKELIYYGYVRTIEKEASVE